MTHLGPRLLTLRTIRRRYTNVPFAVAFAAIGCNNLITLFVRPDGAAAALLASPLDYVWGAMYGTGGLLILAGMGTRRANLEAAGSVLFGGAATIAAISTAIVRGITWWNSVVLLLIFAAMAVIRAYHLAKGRVLVLVDTVADPIIPDEHGGAR